MFSYQCVTCKRNMGNGTCQAFPEGIPPQIARGEVSHIEPIDGDNGLTWLPMDKKSYDLVMASQVGGQSEKYAKQTNLFEEHKHPRDKSGKFTSKGKGDSSPGQGEEKKLPKATPVKRTKKDPIKAVEEKKKVEYPPVPEDEPSEAVQRVASYFGLPHVSAADEKKASNFTVLMAKKLSGDQFSDPESAAEFLESSKDHLQNVIGLATQYGFKTGAKRFGTRAASAQDFLIRQAEKTGYEASGKDYKSAFSGAIDHLREEYAKNPTEEPPIQKDSNGTPWAEVAKFAIGFLLGKRIFDGILGN